MRDDLPPPPSPEFPALSTAELVARKPSSEEFQRLSRHPVSVLLEDVRSLANVGLVFRLCDALRVDRLYLCGITGHPPAPDPMRDPRLPAVQARALREITKTAVMAVPFVPWEYHPDAGTLVETLKREGRQIVAVEQAHGSVSYTAEGNYRPPLCLVLGHERAGVTPPLLEAADLCVEIPVYGMANSLNVAMALGIVGFEILRQQHAFGVGHL